MSEDFEALHKRTLSEKGFTRFYAEDGRQLRINDLENVIADKSTSTRDLADAQLEVFNIVSNIDHSTWDEKITIQNRKAERNRAASAAGILTLLSLLVAHSLLPVGIKQRESVDEEKARIEEQNRRKLLRAELVNIHRQVTQELEKRDRLYSSSPFSTLPDAPDKAA